MFECRILWSLGVLSLPFSALAQSWTYQGNSSCFRAGDNVQCFDQGTMRQYATNQQQFESAYQNGQAVGEGIGLLVRIWIEHHRELELKREDLREQISAYYAATFDLNDQIANDLRIGINACRSLETLDQPNSQLYKNNEDSSSTLISRIGQMKPFTEKNLPGILAAKDMKFLGNSRDLAQKFYRQAKEAAEKQYVFNQFLSGYVGLLQSQRAEAAGGSSPPSTPRRSDVSPDQINSKAMAGDVAAELELGMMYRDGHGVQKDPVAAAKWFNAAAESGDGKAQLALGELFESGRGVIQSFVQAHMWFNVSASLGTPTAEEHRDALSARMTPEQISEAQKMASVWRPRTKTVSDKYPRSVKPEAELTNEAPDPGGNIAATVTSSKVVTESTGSTVYHNPACNNPQGSFMKGFCSTAGTQVHENTSSHAEVIATIGDKSYTLIGNKMPPPGNYTARFTKSGKIELSGKSANGEVHTHMFTVAGVAAIQ